MLCIFCGLLWNTFAARHLTSTTDTVFASATRANTTLNSTLGLHPVDSLTSVDYAPPAPASLSSSKGPAKELLPYQWPRRDDGIGGSHVEVDMERLEDEPRAGNEARRESDGLAESALVAQRRRPSFERRPSFDLHQ